MNNRSPFRLDREAAIEAILYVANRIPRPDFFRISKILYLADIEHLRLYGRFIFGDEYIAMENGPVPSGAYDLMKTPELHMDSSSSFSVEGGFRVAPKRQADLDFLSESDRECLDEAIEKYGAMHWRALRHKSHDQAYEATQRNRAIDIRDIVEMLPNRDGLLQYLELEESCV